MLFFYIVQDIFLIAPCGRKEKSIEMQNVARSSKKKKVKKLCKLSEIGKNSRKTVKQNY